MAARNSVPVLLLTGFLGSGKTSLLANWLKASQFAGAIVIVNELGEVGIDDRLVESSSETPLLLENGCACCAAGEDLMATLERLFWDRLHRKIPKFSWVLIETTGVADPGPILERMAAHSLIRERYHVAGIITTFDAQRGREQLTRHPEVARQLEDANLVILTKMDIASAGEIANASEAIACVRPDVAVVPSAQANVTAAAVIAALGNGRSARIAAAGEARVAVHSQNITTAFVAAPENLEARALVAALIEILTRYDGGLLRLKGIVRLAPDGELRSVQAMPGGGVQFTPVAPPASSEVVTGLTIIAQNTTARTIAKSLTAELDFHMRAARVRA